MTKEGRDGAAVEPVDLRLQAEMPDVRIDVVSGGFDGCVCCCRVIEVKLDAWIMFLINQ